MFIIIYETETRSPRQSYFITVCASDHGRGRKAHIGGQVEQTQNRKAKDTGKIEGKMDKNVCMSTRSTLNFSHKRGYVLKGSELILTWLVTGGLSGSASTTVGHSSERKLKRAGMDLKSNSPHAKPTQHKR